MGFALHLACDHLRSFAEASPRQRALVSVGKIG